MPEKPGNISAPRRSTQGQFLPWSIGKLNTQHTGDEEDCIAPALEWGNWTGDDEGEGAVLCVLYDMLN